MPTIYGAYLCTLDQAKSEIKADGTVVILDEYILDVIGFVSERVESIEGYPLEPREKSRFYDALGQHINDERNSLQLEHPLLEITAIVAGNGTALGTADYRLLPRGETPHDEILLMDTAPIDNWSVHTGSYVEAIEVTGKWAYRQHYPAEAWRVATTTGGTVNASTGTLPLTSVDAVSPGHLLRVESEYMRVSAVGSVSATVERGVRGTTAAAHGSASSVEFFIPDPTATRAVIRWASLLFKRRGDFVQIQLDTEGKVLAWPPDAPAEVNNILEELPDFTLWQGV